MNLPPSQFLGQIRDHRSATVQLEKFSFAVTTLGTASHQWVHENRADKLFLMFQQTPEHQDEVAMKNSLLMIVTVESQTLENQDLKELQTMVEDFENQRHKTFVDHALESPVHVMVKFPCIALRYPKSLTLHRRIQMKFKNEFDYYGVIEIFEKLKFPINKVRSKDSPAASENLVQNRIPASAFDQPSVTHLAKKGKPQTSNTVSDAFHTLLTPLLTNESPFFKRYHNTGSDAVTSYYTARSSSARSLEGSRTSCTLSASSSSEPHVQLNSVINKDNLISAFRPKTMVHPTLLHTSAPERNRLSQPNLSSFQDFNEISTRNKAKSEAFDPLLIEPAAVPSIGLYLNSRHEYDPFRRAKPAYEHLMIEGGSMKGPNNKRMSLVPDFLRPLSAPVQSTPDDFNQWLPPRRELPFPKPRASTKLGILPVACNPFSTLKIDSMTRKASEDGSECAAVENAKPVFFQTSKRLARQRTNKPPVTTHGNTLGLSTSGSPHVGGDGDIPHMTVEREEELSPLAGKGATAGRFLMDQALPSKLMSTATRKRERETEPDILLISKQARIMIDKATQTQTWSGRDHTAPPAIGTGMAQPLSSNPDDGAQHSDSLVNGREALMSGLKRRTPAEEFWQRPGYSEASPEERQAIINDFICENLDNEDFLRICEDVENVWRRIGLEI